MTNYILDEAGFGRAVVSALKLDGTKVSIGAVRVRSHNGVMVADVGYILTPADIAAIHSEIAKQYPPDAFQNKNAA